MFTSCCLLPNSPNCLFLLPNHLPQTECLWPSERHLLKPDTQCNGIRRWSLERCKALAMGSVMFYKRPQKTPYPFHHMDACSLSRVWLCDPMGCSPPRSSAHGFSRQEYWSGLPCPPPGDLPDPGIEPGSPALQADSLMSEPPGKPRHTRVDCHSLLHGIFPDQGWNPRLLHWQAGSEPPGNPSTIWENWKDSCPIARKQATHPAPSRHWTCQSLDLGLPPFRTVKLLLFISHEVNDILLEQPAWTNTESKVVPTSVLFSSTLFFSDNLFSVLSPASRFYKFSVSSLPLLSQLFFHLTSRWSKTKTEQINK